MREEDVRRTLTGIIVSVMPQDFAFPEGRKDLHLARDLGMDSLALVSLLVLCEQEFGVKLSRDPDFLNKMATLEMAVDYLAQRTSA